MIIGQAIFKQFQMKRFLCYIFLTVSTFIMTENCLAVSIYSPLRERIYVQTDKHLYLAGETILMKFLTTDPELIPLAFSKVAYAELVADSIARLQIKVKLTGGIGTGRILLPSDLPTGYYLLIAYTQFMRNEGPEVFFEKNIVVMNTFQSGYQPEPSHDGEMTMSNFTEDEAPTLLGRVVVGFDKTTYTKREYGELILNGLPDNIHTLSVSIVGKELVPVAESNVSLFRKIQTKKTTSFSGEFLPEYEGHIITGKIIDQTATDTINSVSMKKIIPDNSVMIPETGLTGQMKTLDSLLQILHHSFDKNTQVLSENLRQALSSAQKKNSGNLTNYESDTKYLPHNNGYISTSNTIGISFPGEGIRFFAGQETKTGSVRFFTSGIFGTKEIATVAYDTDDKYRVDIQSPFVNRYAPKQMPALHVDSACYDLLLDRTVALQVFRYFSEEPSANHNVLDPYFKFKPTFSYLLDEYTRFATMREVFVEFISGARFRSRDGKQEIQVRTKRGSFNYYGTTPLVLLDGVPVLDHNEVYNYNPLSVERINIYYGPCILNGTVFDGIVEMITYSRFHADLHLNRTSQLLSYDGLQLPYLYDTPDYSEDAKRQSRTPDGRHTLLWNPDVRTNGNPSVRLSFNTSDLSGEFQATIEGVTKTGEIIFATAVFMVE